PPDRAPAPAALGPPDRRAPTRAGVHRARRGRALRSAGGGVGADSRPWPHARGARAGGVQEARAGPPAPRGGRGGEEGVRIAGPGHTPEELARVAFKKHVRLARLEGGALGVGGIVTAAPDLVALLWLQSRLVWYIAAAYGFDPNHPMRPAEYLALQGLYDTPAEAREALDGVGRRMAIAMAERALSHRRNDALHLRLPQENAKRKGRRYGGRLLPVFRGPY